MPDYVVTVVDMMFVCITLMSDYVVTVSDKERDSAQRDEVIENLRLSLMATACHKASTTEQVVNLSLDFLQNQDNLVRPAWKERPDTAGADPGF